MRLGNVITVNPESIRNGYPFDEIEYIDISSVGTGTLQGTQRLQIGDAPSRAKRIVRNGDTLLATVRPNLRSFWFARNARENAIASTGFAVLRAGKDIDAGFLYFTVTNQPFTDYLTANAKGAAYPAVDTDTIERSEIYLPPLPTQRKIAAVLSAYDDLIENNLRRIKILEEMAQNLYREWFVKFRFPGHQQARFTNSPLGRIPEGWEVVQLGEMADVHWGDTSTTKSSYVRDGYTAYSATGADGALEHYDYDRDGIVLSAIGANCGITWFATGKWSCIKNTIRFWSSNPRVSTEYLFYATLGKNFWPKRGAAQPFISQGDAKGIAIVIPCKDMNRQFEDFVKPTLAQFRSLSKKNTTLRRTRDLLLPKLISGEVDVSTLDITVPEKARA